MIIFPTVSRMLPIIAVISAGSFFSAHGLVGKINAHKHTLGAICVGTALPKNADAAKAAIETAGVFLDNGQKSNPLAVPVNFTVNWATRKALRGMGTDHFKISHFGSKGDDVVGLLVEAATVATPQAVATLAIMLLESASSSSSSVSYKS